VNETQKKQADRAHLWRNATCVGSHINWRVSLRRIQECIDRQNVEGGTNSALWLLHGDSHRLFLQDGSSKDYAWQASLCSDLAYSWPE